MTPEKIVPFPAVVDLVVVQSYLLDNSRKICGFLSWIWENAVQQNDAFSACLDNVNNIARCIHLTLYLLQKSAQMSTESVQQTPQVCFQLLQEEPNANMGLTYLQNGWSVSWRLPVVGILCLGQKKDLQSALKCNQQSQELTAQGMTWLVVYRHFLYASASPCMQSLF